MRAIVITKPGGPEVLAAVDRPRPEPSRGEVRVRVRATAVNRADLLQRMGAYPAPADAPADIPGLELAGEVDALGPGVERLAIGDRVFGLVGGGSYAEAIVTHERALAKIPDGLSFEDAAAIPEAFITAHDAVAVQAALRPGEHLLVHGAAGAVGSAAVQIGVQMGARVMGVVRHERGRELMHSLGATPVDDDDFAAAVAQHTGGHGADVVLELVGAPHFPANLEAVATRGRIVVVGVGRRGDHGLVAPAAAAEAGEPARHRATGSSARGKAAALRAFEREVIP
nr:zinc-binding dehydrogenase [Myxococcota bacterium]